MNKTLLTSAIGFVGLALAGCSSAPPPQQLVDARSAYNRASRSQAQQLSPAELHDARIALQRAEKQYKDDARSGKTVDLSYIAQRKAELAETQAQTIDLRRQEQDIQAAQQQAQAKAAEEAKGELETTRGELATEREARLAAEADAAAALAKLAQSGTETKTDQRGTIITMPGTFMFSSGKADLRPRAKTKLNEVATALEEQGDKNIVVEGYTDSTGGEELNMRLSEARANAVRDYLVKQGVEDSKIISTGLGPSNPVADNKTAEGRAENRRVEIVVTSQNPMRMMQPSWREQQGQQPGQMEQPGQMQQHPMQQPMQQQPMQQPSPEPTPPPDVPMP